MLEPGNNEALKIETARCRTGMIRQYQSMGPVEIVSDMAAHAVVFLRCCQNCAERNISVTSAPVRVRCSSSADASSLICGQNRNGGVKTIRVVGHFHSSVIFLIGRFFTSQQLIYALRVDDKSCKGPP
jgi:hypothetical protein